MSSLFNTDMTSSNFSSYRTKVETYQSDVATLETNLSSYLTNAQTYTDSINLGDWSDKVETKFSNFITNSLQKGITAMDDDLTGGSFKTLKDTLKDLYTSVDTCYKKKDQIEKKTLQLDRTPEYNTVTIPNPTPSYMTDLSSTDDDYITAKEKNPAYTQLEEDIKTLKGELETAVGEANGHVDTLTALNFDPSDESSGDGGDKSGGKSGDKSGDKKGDKDGNKDGDKDGDKDSGKDTDNSGDKKSDNGLPPTDGNADYQAFTDIYPGDNQVMRGHMSVDPNTGNWIVQDEFHNATLYVPNGDGTITQVYLGSVDGCDTTNIFNTVKENGVDGFVNNVEDSKDIGSSMYLVGSSTFGGTVTYSSKDGEDGYYLPHVNYDDPDNYENALHGGFETNRMTDAYMDGSGQKYEGKLQTWDEYYS